MELVKETNDDRVASLLSEIDWYINKHREMVSRHQETMMETVTEQPSNLGHGQLRDFQIKGLEWLVSLHNNNVNGILADEMGLGKTIQTVALVAYLMEKKNINGPYMIIVPKSTISNWELTFRQWAPDVIVAVNDGKSRHRREMHKEMKETFFDVLITGFGCAINDKAFLAGLKWKYIIVDKGHRVKNEQSKLAQVVQNDFYASHRLLLTGTPLQNNLPELWALLKFLHPSIFESGTILPQFEPFIAPSENGVKVQLTKEDTILIIKRLHTLLRPYMLRRLKKEVEPHLPPKVEYVIKCEMSALQRVLYKHIDNNSVLPTDGSEKGNEDIVLANKVVQLRKVCNHPFLFRPIKEAYYKHMNAEKEENAENSLSPLCRTSGKLALLDRILRKLWARKRRVLLFCQMTKCMEIIEEFLNWRAIPFLRLDGRTSSAARRSAVNKFNSSETVNHLFLLSTRAGGEGLNLQTADTVIFYDSDWNPQNDLQAQDRTHRIGQSQEVRVLRLVTLNSIEERVMAVARQKLNLHNKVVEAGFYNLKSTDSERQQFMQNLLDQDEMGEEISNEVSDDNTINAMIARSAKEMAYFATMDTLRKEKQVRSFLIGENELPSWLREAAERCGT